MTHRINIVSKRNGVGLDQDVDLVASVLQEAGYDVSFSAHRKFASLWRIVQKNKKYDANIFMERVHTRWCGLAKQNFLIPNQERFPKRLLHKLQNVDAICTKTHHAQQIFSQYHKNTHYIGFSSKNLYDGSIQKDYRQFLHLAGRSTLKGTETILSIWRQHPEWPKLTVIQHGQHENNMPDNIHIISERLDNMALKQLLNSCGTHLCLSRAEGWGHYIAEAMGCGALVVATNAPPMNELVIEKRGRLVNVERQNERHLGTEYFVSPLAFEQCITELLGSDATELNQIAAAARVWYLNNDKEFKMRLLQFVKRQLNKNY